MTQPVAAALGEFLATTPTPSLPGDVIEKARVCVMDALADACAAFGVAPCREMLGLVRELEDPKASSTVWLTDIHAKPMDCVLANGAFVHGLLHDDTLQGARAHPESMVVTSAIAMGQATGASGHEVLGAIAMGYEAIGRLGARFKVSTPMVSVHGFRASPALGIFGAAVASARLLGHDSQKMHDTLCAASSLASGINETTQVGSMEWRFHNPAAARNGILAALLAGRGFHGASTAFEGPSGFFNAFAGVKGTPGEVLAGLGTDYQIRYTVQKPYPSCGSNQVILKLMERLAEQHGAINPAEVQDINVQTLPRLAEHLGIQFAGPFNTVEQALVSMPFAIGSMLVNGHFDSSIYDKLVADPTVADLARRVRIVSQEAEVFPDYLNVLLQITLKNGRKLEARGKDVGTAPFDLGFDAVSKKFQRMAQPYLDAGTQAKITSLVSGLEKEPSVRRLGELLTVKPKGKAKT